MRKYLLASAFALLALPAVAGPPIGGISQGDVIQGNVQSGVNSAISTGQIGSNSEAVARSNAAGGNAQGGAGGAGGRGGRSSVVNNNTISGGGGGGYPSTIRNTPSSTLALATAYCQNSGGVAGSGPGFSFSAAMGRHDADCIRLNYAMLLSALGETEAALLVVANNREVNAALTEARQRAAARPMAAQPIVAMNPAAARDPRPSAADCRRLRRLRDPSQVQRDYLVNCAG